MKVIFLDFDGVLNSVQYDRSRSADQGNIDETRLVLLKELIAQTGARIVLSTSWRKHWNHDPSLCDSVGEEINAVFGRSGLQIYDKTPEMKPSNRTAEIRAWLQAHSGVVTDFVILDDIVFGWEELEPCLVKTNPRIGRGLERSHVEKAAALLK